MRTIRLPRFLAREHWRSMGTIRLARFRMWEHWRLALVLAVAFINGIIYLYTVPAWQHYDEPNHFEYAWLVAHRPGLPKPGDADPELNRQVVRSMIEHDFYWNMGPVPDVDSGQPVEITGVSQLGDRPFYYILASVPLRLLRGYPVETQLYGARWLSVLLFVLTILAAWGFVSELVSKDNLLRWLVPLALALWPGFVDIMSSMNSDVGAVFIFSWFLWAAVRLIRRGFSWIVFLGAVGLAVLGNYTKQSASPAMLLVPVGLLFSVLRGRWRRVAWGVLGAGVLVLFLSVFTWGDAAFWFRDTLQGPNDRVQSSRAPGGETAFQLEILEGKTTSSLIQVIPIPVGRKLSGTTVTFGAWMWASAPVKTRSITLRAYNIGKIYFKDVLVDETPTFQAMTVTLPTNATRLRVVLPVPNDPSAIGERVYYDGLVLVEGARPLDQVPSYDGQGETGQWGGAPFVNYIRNPSAEQDWPRIRTWADALGDRFIRGGGKPSMVLYFFLDEAAAGGYRRSTMDNLYRSFWGKFGWGGVNFLGHRPYRALGVVGLLSLPGVVLLVWRKRAVLPWDVMVWTGLAVGLIFGLAFISGAFYFDIQSWRPPARYVYPAMVPVLLLLCAGWWEVLNLPRRWLRIHPMVPVVIYSVFFLGLNVYGILSIVRYYSGLGA